MLGVGLGDLALTKDSRFCDFGEVIVIDFLGWGDERGESEARGLGECGEEVKIYMEGSDNRMANNRD